MCDAQDTQSSTDEDQEQDEWKRRASGSIDEWKADVEDGITVRRENLASHRKAFGLVVWPPLHMTRSQNPKGLWFVKWFVPGFLAGCGFLTQNALLHIGTYNYVHQMLQYDLRLTQTIPEYTVEAQNNVTYVYPIPLTIGKHANNVSYGSLNDPFAGWLGAYKHIEISSLDHLAMMFPLGFGILSVLLDDLPTWTRTLLCMSLLAAGKGALSAITVVPDSIGWEECKTRLNQSPTFDVSWYAMQHSVWTLMFEVNPVSRLCADMMYSGHTYFVTLFAMGLLELTRTFLREKRRGIRLLGQYIVSFAAILQQVIEIY